ncbi:MAG: OmpA family protein [Gammaproteobacteria bacterium]|nr:OmpA family protein [Gammaproteobacteria bacterium]
MSKKTFLLPITLLSSLIISSSAFAAIKGNAGYVTDSSGNVVRDPFGECWHTGSWSPKLAIAECAGGKAVKMTTKPAPRAIPAPVTRLAENTPPPVTQPKKPAFEPVVLKSGALFASGKASLGNAGLSELDALAKRIKATDTLRSIEIVGHTDSMGNAEMNQKLSESRAAAVKTYLEKQGIAAARITSIGMGESNPVADNDTAEGRAQNRRVEVIFKGKQQIK